MRTTTAALSPDKLGDILVRDGLITSDQLKRALAEQRSSGMRLGYTLVKLGFIEETEITKMLARQYRMPAVDLSRFEVDPKILKLITPDIANKYTVLPLKREGRTLTIAIADPNNVAAIEDIKFITRCDIFPVIAGEYTLRNAIDRYYQQSDAQLASLLKSVEDQGSEDLEVVEEQMDDEVKASELAEDAPVVKLINGLLTDAVKRGASDIHIEPFEHEMRVRYRVDGALHEVMKPPIKMRAALTSRVKIMAQLNIAERRVPQDGRIKLKMGHRVIDFRVSTLPVLFGEKIVLRILDKGNLTFDLSKFGFEPKAESDLLKAILNPYGMVLVTGPTGSGKTTTLYAALNEIRNEEDKIITIEDPVEYQLHGITQIPVNEKKGLTFARGLRSILRHDPDKIMVGEIRDEETAQIAIQSALTGHLVFTTVHANNVIDVIGRFLNMGVEPYNFVSSLNCVLAQRLVRVLCTFCRRAFHPSDVELMESGLRPEENRNRVFYANVGCDACNHTGYRGRTAIHELLDLSDNIREMIVERRPGSEVRRAAEAEGLTSLRESALKKVFSGVSTLHEINRVTFVEEVNLNARH